MKKRPKRRRKGRDEKKEETVMKSEERQPATLTNMHQRDPGPKVGLIGSSLMVTDACTDSSGPAGGGAGSAGT